MNKRAKQRLIGVTALVIIAVGGLILYTSQGSGAGAYRKTISEVVSDTTLVGQQVQVEGPVVAGSWTAGASPFAFEIEDQEAGDGTTLQIVWDGAIPSAFGDGTVAIVTGIVEADQSVTAKTLITQCPSKYESATGALTVAELLESDDAVDAYVGKLAGYVVTGSIQAAGTAERFYLADQPGSGEALAVSFDGALPSGMEDGSLVVLGGKLGADGRFIAESVALDESEQ